MEKTRLLEVIACYAARHDFESVLPVSAKTGEGLEELFAEIEKFAEESPHLFPDDMITDQPERQIVAEVIREKILRLTDEEVPHGAAVVIEDFIEKKDLISVRAEIFCEKPTHKGIIIGKNGEMLKKIGTYAREDLESFFGCRFYLDLWVKVKKNWRDSVAAAKNFGYDDN